MILFLISCMTYKTTHTGIVDYINRNSCVIELYSGTLIEIESKSYWCSIVVYKKQAKRNHRLFRYIWCHVQMGLCRKLRGNK